MELNSEYQNIGNVTYLWTSTPQTTGHFVDEEFTFCVAAGFDKDHQETGTTFAQKIEGFPIRCVMDK